MLAQNFDYQRYSKLILVFFFLIGFIFRALFIHSIRLDYDEGLYLFIGQLYKNNSIIEGFITNFPKQTGEGFSQPPLVSLMYTVLYSFLPLDYSFGRIANVFLSSCCIVLTYMIVKEIWDIKTGLIASFIVMIDPTLASGILMSLDGLTSFFLCLSCLLIVKTLKNNKLRWHFITGVSFGLCMLTKWTLTIVPVTYVVFYLYYSIWVNDNDRFESLRNVIVCASVAFAIFLPWFFWMGIIGVLPFIFVTGNNIRITNPLNSLYKTWTHSPLLLVLTIFAFLFFFINRKKTRFPLAWGFFVIFPFFLLMPRYYDFAPIFYCFVILAAKPCTYFFEQTYDFFTELKMSKFNLNNITVKHHQLLSVTIVMLVFTANSGMIAKEALYDSDQTVQQTVKYIKNTTTENTVIISPPHFGALVAPRPWYSTYSDSVGNGYLLIYSPLIPYTQKYIDGVQNGFISENSEIFLFIKIAIINDVEIYRIQVNQTSST